MLPVHIAAPVAVDPSEVLPRAADQAARPVRPVRADRRPRGVGRRRRTRASTPERLGVVIASGIGGVTTLLDAYDTLKETGARRVSPLTVPMLMPNGPAALVGLELGARAGVHTPVSACAIRRRGDRVRRRHDPHRPRRRRRRRRHRGGDPPAAARRLRRDAGAVDPQRRARARLAALRQGPRRLRARRGRRRPRARDRSSTRRPAARTIYAEVAGAGITSDAHHIAAARPGRAPAPPARCGMALDGAGADAVRRRAHQRARHLDPGRRRRRGRGHPRRARRRRRRRLRLGDQVDDRSPARRRRRRRDDRDRCWRCTTARRPPTINLEDPDDDVHLDVVRGEPRTLPDGELLALNNSFGFGGHNVALAVRSV